MSSRDLNASASTSAPVAVILAAGMGTRLRSMHDGPKGFVEVGGEPIIARSLRRLRQAGVNEFIIVVGWQEMRYRSWFAESDGSVRCISNSEYATTGSLRSLLIGAELVRGRAIVIVESDLIYETRAARAVVASASPDNVLISGPTKSGDEVWVYKTADGALEHMSKTPAGDRVPAGELVGLVRLSASAVEELRATAGSLPASAHYEDGLNVIASRRRIELTLIPDLVWAEIDDPNHLARAREQVWPSILKRDGVGTQIV